MLCKKVRPKQHIKAKVSFGKQLQLSDNIDKVWNEAVSDVDQPSNRHFLLDASIVMQRYLSLSISVPNTKTGTHGG